MLCKTCETDEICLDLPVLAITFIYYLSAIIHTYFCFSKNKLKMVVENSCSEVISNPSQ